MSSPSFTRTRLWCVFLGVILLLPSASFAQGCLAARSHQGTIDELCDGTSNNGAHSSGWLHNLSFNVSWRSFSSFRHYIGTVEQVQREVNHNQIQNHQNLYDISFDYQLSPRWSLIADIPVLQGTRNQLYPPKGIYDIAGLGDVLVGAQMWLFRPPTEKNANIAFSYELKLPTGVNDATGTAVLKNGQVVKAVADQSMQPGDSSWGFSLGTQAYKQVWFRTMSYFQASYLFNPRNTDGVPTFRTKPGEEVMSVTDQYLVRGGIAHAVPKIRHLSLSFGGRMEGIPVRDAFGGSDGFRRPGYIISIDPGLMYSYRHEMISVNGPWAIERNRRRSTSDIKNGTHGDAAFADYTLIVSVSHHF